MQFLSLSAVLRIHALLISETGGQPGLRDRGLLASALKAAEHRYYYEQVDAVGCAAAYAYHLCMAHAFVDGNKRVAAAVTETFLLQNGYSLALDNSSVVALFLDIARGQLTRASVETTLRRCTQQSGG